jgi:cytochrome c-type biogenesis protein CcmH/NrfF
MIFALLADLIFVAPFGLLLVGVVVFFVSRRRRRRAEDEQSGANEPVD